MSIIKTLRERETPLSVADFAKLMNVTESTVQRWVRRRQVPSFRIGDTIRFDATFLADWFELQSSATKRFFTISLTPRPAEDPSEFQMKWEDLGNLASPADDK